MNRRTQAQVALLAALVFLIVGVALLAVLGAGLVAGVTGSGALLLSALTAGVFALAIRLIFLARSMRRDPAETPTAPPSRRSEAVLPTARAPKPRPRPANHPGTRTR